jgi:hypothetical protein
MPPTEFARVLGAVQDAAALNDEFTTDDVWPLLNFTPTERNIVGKAFAEANRIGLIEGTERFIRSTRPEAKGRRVQVWRATHSPSLFAG